MLIFCPPETRPRIYLGCDWLAADWLADCKIGVGSIVHPSSAPEVKLKLKLPFRSVL